MFELDTSQKLVATLPIEERCIVTAGPGSGKTRTAAARLEYFESSLEAPGESSVLFISFSRASIRAALKSLGNFIAECELYVDARTIDSLALQICHTYVEEFGGPEPPSDFEARLCMAARFLHDKNFDATSDICHVIIDESQDIIGPRRDFLLALLSNLTPNAGITMFTDPAQSIYQFLVKDKKDSQPWESFKSQLTEIGVNSSYSLSGQYRARSRTAKSLMASASSFREEKDEINGIRILDAAQSMLPHCSIGKFIDRVESRNGNAAILFRDNAQVAMAFQTIVNSGKLINHPLRLRLLREWRPAFGAWLAMFGHHIDGRIFSTFSLKAFLNEIDEHGVLEHLSNYIDFAYDDTMSWTELTTYARYFSFEDLSETDDALVLSTIHQSKGLEFDFVGVHETDSLVNGREPEPELAFVALTRAQQKTYSIEHSFPKAKNRGNRKVTYTKGKFIPGKAKAPETILITPQDVEAVKASEEAFRTLAAAQFGNLVDFDCINPHSELPRYRCSLGGVVVGSTTSDFGKNIQKFFPEGAPKRLSSVPIDGVETSLVRVDGQLKAQLKPRPLGFAEFVTDSNPKD